MPSFRSLVDIERQVCDVAATQLERSRFDVTPASRLIEDLNCDSLELVELIMTLEDRFDATLPTNPWPVPVVKAVFTRQPFRLADLAEAFYLSQGTGAPRRDARGQRLPAAEVGKHATFTQLGGRWQPAPGDPLYVPLEVDGGLRQFRRRSDGMVCVEVPGAQVTIGCDSTESGIDERPQHEVELDTFLIDIEPVTTTAWCRFLNTIGPVEPAQLQEWFVPAPDDKRHRDLPVEFFNGQWRPCVGCERWPMVLVSWHGANAYSLWANGRPWRDASSTPAAATGMFLPSEAQWEYAARGARYREFPWGNAPPDGSLLRYGQHDVATQGDPHSLPMAGVHEPFGLSPFGLRHMAGNVWHWCRDWYDEQFYSRPESQSANPVNRRATGVRSERGGSWVGPAQLCRSSFRRGRPPEARGRCLGFRCVGDRLQISE